MKFFKFWAQVSMCSLISVTAFAEDVIPPDIVLKKFMKFYQYRYEHEYDDAYSDKLFEAMNKMKTKEFIAVEKEFFDHEDQLQEQCPGEICGTVEYNIYWNGQDFPDITNYKFEIVEKDSTNAAVFMSAKWEPEVENYTFNCFQLKFIDNEWKINGIINPDFRLTVEKARKQCTLSNKHDSSKIFRLIGK